MLTTEQIESFVCDGYVKVERAFPDDVGNACRGELWAATGYDPDDAATWRESLVRLGGFGTPPFRAAANAPALHEAFDQLVGVDAWLPRTGLGTFPLRFPSAEPAREAGWHVEAGFAGSLGEQRLNLRSRGRALLMLFLFSDVGPDDAPTLVRVGSHLDVAPLLAPAGAEGVEWMALCQLAVPASDHRAVIRITGQLGDVYLCHPFLVHSASSHSGKVPRFMAQPELAPAGELELDTGSPSPVARAVNAALASPHPGRS